MSGPLVDDFARRLVTLRLMQRQKTSFSRQLCVMSRPLVDNLAPRLVTLRLVKLIQRQKTFFSRQLCVLRHPLLDDFCTTTRHFMSNLMAQGVLFKSTLRIESS